MQSRASIRQAPLIALLAGALTTLACSAGAAPIARAATAQTLVIAGAGDGHGVGMSQDGAYGYAKHGWSSQAILAHYYTGTTIGQAPPAAVVRVLIGATVHRVPLERYVRGVVSAEVPSAWPQAALEAQAIASRTYALTAHAGGSRFDVYSDTRSQVYRGVAAETAQTNAAVAATAGQIVTYAGRPAAYDTGAPSHWRLSLSFHAAATRLQGLVKGKFCGIEVLRRGYSPRILMAAILGTAGNTRIAGADLAARLGLQDTWAYFAVRTGSGPVKPEPDHSGWSPPAAPAPTPLAAPAGVQGGTPASGATQDAGAGGTIAR